MSKGENRITSWSYEDGVPPPYLQHFYTHPKVMSPFNCPCYCSEIPLARKVIPPTKVFTICLKLYHIAPLFRRGFVDFVSKPLSIPDKYCSPLTKTPQSNFSICPYHHRMGILIFFPPKLHSRNSFLSLRSTPRPQNNVCLPALATVDISERNTNYREFEIIFWREIHAEQTLFSLLFTLLRCNVIIARKKRMSDEERRGEGEIGSCYIIQAIQCRGGVREEGGHRQAVFQGCQSRGVPPKQRKSLRRYSVVPL